MQARIKLFRGPGPDNRGGGLFICEFDVSAIVVNVYLRRYIRRHNLILKTRCYHISDNIKISNVYIHRRFQFLAEMSPGPLHNADWGHGHCGPPPLIPCLSILNGLLQHIDFGFYFSISLFLSFSSYF
jgi:hypothetical protein